MRFPGRNKYNMNYSLRRYMAITPTIVYFGRAFGSQYEPVATFFFCNIKQYIARLADNGLGCSSFSLVICFGSSGVSDTADCGAEQRHINEKWHGG